MGGIEAALAERAFKHLFIECLGWDHARASTTLECRGHSFEMVAIAQKRGFTVFLSPAHRTVLANRRLLREVQRKFRKLYHEHILIHYCETPRKQVWQWATSIGDGRRVLHREHPFFSNDPPLRLLERIAKLAVGIEEEEQTTLVDVLQRVRNALMPEGEQNLFAKRPGYAVKSDLLAMAIKAGEPGAFDRFVEFHMPLARRSSKMLVRWFGMSSDDAEQTAMIGLIEAARRFDPERGFQFSTYAGFRLRQVCQRYGLSWGLPIRMPSHVFWPCYRMTFTWARLVAAHGAHDAMPYFEKELAKAGVSRKQWGTFRAARQVGFLSELDRDTFTELTASKSSLVIDRVSAGEHREGINLALTSLSLREAEILRLRYGFGGTEHTLQEVADGLGITRERVRQIQQRAEERLRQYLQRSGVADDFPSDQDIEKTIPTSEATE